ncbi:MarR family transcriptional regulator [Salinibacterium sp. ZJ454]|uniref:MarR family winged helix-turn-helix transcriptional regulator n=1 Tax=Salinibacterium sp. ZJ454 TaxID=2708339 RepID=UPI001422C6C4|nr:MarR family transcriptional regulator [Salinibacterium sp. ZJ454]
MDSELATLLGEILATVNRLERIAYQSVESSKSSTYYRTLGALRQFGPQRASALAQHYRVSQPAMSRVITALVDDGLVVREPDSTDSRASIIRISELGERVYLERLNAMGRAVTPYFAEISVVDRAVLGAALEVLKINQSRAGAGLA